VTELITLDDQPLTVVGNMDYLHLNLLKSQQTINLQVVNHTDISGGSQIKQPNHGELSVKLLHPVEVTEVKVAV